MQQPKDSQNSTLKDNHSSAQNEVPDKEILSEEASKEKMDEKVIPIKNNEKKEEPVENKEAKPIENKPNKEESLAIPTEDKTKKEDPNVNKSGSHCKLIESIAKSLNNIILSSKNEEKPAENVHPKEENSNAILPPKEEDKIEKKDEPPKEKTKDDYVFPIPNNNQKLEESKNSENSYYLYKFPQINFGSLNLKIPENLRPKNKDLQSQNYHNYSMTYFNPITFSCSLNTHSNRRSKVKPIENEEEFFEKIIKIADVSNVNEFWEVFQHLKKPNQCPVGSDYHIFKKGIVPMWEDKMNKDGGKLSVLLTWKYANVIWEEVTFNFAKGLLPYYGYINGIVISVRPKFLALSFWIKCGNSSMVEKIRNALSGLLQAPSNNCFDFIPFH